MSKPAPSPAGTWRLGALPDLLSIPVNIEVDLPPSLRGADVVRGVLRLADSVETGARFSVDARIAAAQEDAQQASRRAAWRQLGPKVDLRAADGRGQYASVGNETPPLSRGDRSVVLRQPLFDWTTYHEALRQAENAEAAGLTREGAQSQAALDAGNAYLSVLQSALVVGYTAEYEDLLRKLMRYMEDRTSAGGASAADLERVRARVENARASVSENRAGLVTNLSQFARLTGQLPEKLEIPPPLAAATLPGNDDGAMAQALSGNLDLRAARRLAVSARIELRGSTGRLLPRLDLELSRTENRNPSGTPGRQTDQRALVILSWNVFNSGVDQAQRDATAAKGREFELRVENAERRLRQQIENAYSVLDSIDVRYAAVREEVGANRKVVAAFTEQLFATNRQLLDVLDAYQRYYQAKVDVTNLAVTEAQVRLQLAHLLGVLRTGSQ